MTQARHRLQGKAPWLRQEIKNPQLLLLRFCRSISPNGHKVVTIKGLVQRLLEAKAQFSNSNLSETRNQSPVLAVWMTRKMLTLKVILLRSNIMSALLLLPFLPGNTFSIFRSPLLRVVPSISSTKRINKSPMLTIISLVVHQILYSPVCLLQLLNPTPLRKISKDLD